jgi:excinuclease ABC subunit C
VADAAARATPPAGTPPHPAPEAEPALTLKEKVRRLPREPGIYMMKDAGGMVLYIGKAKNLKNRVASYFDRARERSAKISALIALIADFDHRVVRNEAEALLLEGRLIKEWRPKFNTLLRDDKQFLQIRVDMRQPLPVFRLVRNRVDESSRYFGPYPYPAEVKRTLLEMRKRFGILLSDAHPVELGGGNWRLYDDARAEITPFPNETTEAEYRARAEAGCEFLEGRVQEWADSLREKMRAAAEAREYERAASLRDMLEAIRRTTAHTRRFHSRAPEPPTATADAKEAIRELQEALGMGVPPRTMECFDISHISGTFVVASLVRFADGRPDKGNYRRFKIRGHVGNDDFRSMEEVVGRRYKRLHDEGREFPRLIVIDGGAGQVGAAMKAFAALGITPPALVGLAKREELIIFPGARPPLALPRHSPALRMVQRLRDEAHRFANTYNADLRSRRIRESLLEDCPGLGRKRSESILSHFGSLAALRKASEAEIAGAPGIGPVFAKNIHAFLHAPPAPR